jgi:tRNA1Val (adenine37-N6)-methyltransferase
MSNNWFRFKQFNIQQKNSAMKVGTDGVLLGAWANGKGAKKALDIGCGTGLIALLLAQRFSSLKIDAVEIDKSSCIDAGKNIIDSPWSNRINLFNMAIQDFQSNAEKSSYDLILSNPPYFRASLKPSNVSRARARHDKDLSLIELVENSAELLATEGILAIIIPSDFHNEAIELAGKNNLYPKRKLWLKPTTDKSTNRILMEFSFQDLQVVEEELVIEEFGRHKYSEDYISLTRDFYLKMD